MKFTEENKEQAIMLETIVGHTLAKHFLDEIREEPEMNIEELSKLPMEEQLKTLGENLKRAQEADKKARLLQDIQNGKYRLMFLALAAGTDELAKRAVADLSPEEFREKQDQIFERFMNEEEANDNGEG